MPRKTRKQLMSDDHYDESYEADLRAEAWARLVRELNRAWRRQQRRDKAKTGRRKVSRNDPSATPETE